MLSYFHRTFNSTRKRSEQLLNKKSSTGRQRSRYFSLPNLLPDKSNKPREVNKRRATWAPKSDCKLDPETAITLEAFRKRNAARNNALICELERRQSILKNLLNNTNQTEQVKTEDTFTSSKSEDPSLCFSELEKISIPSMETDDGTYFPVWTTKVKEFIQQSDSNTNFLRHSMDSLNIFEPEMACMRVNEFYDTITNKRLSL